MKTDRALDDSFVDGHALRTQLTELAGGADGDGSGSDVRLTVLAALKEAVKAGRASIEQRLILDGSGQKCAERLCRLQDEIITCIHDYAITHVFRASNLSSGERMAIVCVGGYGRGSLAPGSDIDLLFLLPYKQTALGESIVEYILYMLWDLGFKVGHATRSVEDCLRLSVEDITIRTSILEARFLLGQKALYADMMTRFDETIVRKTAKEFIAAKLEERDNRHKKAGQSRYLVEPNVKESKGGQRDLHTLFWIAKYYYRVRSQQELRKAGVFSTAEFTKFKKAQDFLWAVRCHLHFVTGRAEERLSFELQPVLAERLNYADRPGASAVERFMKHYFLIAKDVGDLTRILCSTLEEQRAKSATGLYGMIGALTRRSKAIRGTTDFLNQNNRITISNETVFDTEPVNLIRMFQLADEHDLLFHPDAMQLATRSLNLIDAALRKDPNANALFLSVLTSKKRPERVLRKMNECGVLGRFIPDFGKVVAMMQFNMYHHYTVDEHLLRSIGVLSEIDAGAMEQQHPLANMLMSKIQQRRVLYVALLLHDIAKGRPEDHSIAGARVARRVCPRLGMSAQETELVSWLITHHLLMSNIAQTRDLNDPKTIQDFAETMQSMERMQLLLILTVCDIKAVGPGVWNGWKAQLLRTLYYEAEPILNGGFSSIPRKERIHGVLGELRSAFADWSKEDVERILALPYSNYWLMVDRADQKRQLAFIRQTDERGDAFATNVFQRAEQDITEITILAQDHPRLLSTLAGCCSAAGANIVSAQIFTLRDGRALDTIVIQKLYTNAEDEERRGMQIARSIEKVLRGEVRLAKLIADKENPNRRTDAFDVEPRVKIDNTISEDLTVIEVEALDRPGLLSDIANALADLSLDIASAHIATFGEKAQDTFYLTDFAGQKIQSPQKLAAVRKKLLATLGQNQHSSTAPPTLPKPSVAKSVARPAAKKPKQPT
ncbi:MAG: [protein-PII] uridylyltransferase [Pseudomonadota bacterium]